MKSKACIAGRAATAASVLEAAWWQLRTMHQGLPKAVVNVMTAGDRKRAFGHMAPSSWRYQKRTRLHEIAISPALFNHPKEVLAVMLHEAAHALLVARRGNGGTNGYYHRREFRDAAVMLGLDCEFKNTRYGFSITRWPRNWERSRGLASRNSEILRLLRERLPWGTTTQLTPGFSPKQIPQSGQVRLVCSCKRSIYASKGEVKRGSIKCRICRRDFRKAKASAQRDRHAKTVVSGKHS